jgi:hypothetical protein
MHFIKEGYVAIGQKLKNNFNFVISLGKKITIKPIVKRNIYLYLLKRLRYKAVYLINQDIFS